MAYLTRYAGKSVSLLGFGRSSEALLSDLLSSGARVCVRDRSLSPRAATAAWEEAGGRFRLGDGWLDDLSEDVLIRSPAVRPDLPEIIGAPARGAILSSECELFCELCPATVLFVTGSDGKTTTATLAARFLSEGVSPTGARVFLGGNIGEPLFSHLSEMRPSDFAVLELSSFQLMGNLPPASRAVITNISENHLNWHHGMGEYVAAKRRVLREGTHAILNADNAYTAEIALQYPKKTLFSSTKTRKELLCAFGECPVLTLEGGCIALDGRALLSLSDIRVAGMHNLENFMAALGLVSPYLPEGADLLRVSRAFSGVAHRLEEVGILRGVRYIGSSIDSTPTRTAASLAAVGRCTYLLCGGRGKGLSFVPLREAVIGRVGTLIVFGECRAEIASCCFGFGGRILSVPSMREAVALAKCEARAGDTVLLSPAATSFDEFLDFEERGECFRRAVLCDE